MRYGKEVNMAEKKKSSFLEEFKTFIARGNVVDMAVGVVIGSAFTAIVNELVQGIINPLIGKLVGNINLSDLKIVLAAATEDTPESAILYGSFIQSIINFLIVAFSVFLIIRTMNKIKDGLKKKEEAEKKEEKIAEPSEEILLLREIRDSLKK